MTERRRQTLCAITALLALLPTSAQATRLHVNADIDDSGGGQSWETALQSVEAALAIAEAGDEIWVTAGIYRLEGDAFTLPSGVTLLGGFSGVEDAAAQRDPRVNVTVLSGDRFANDAFNDPLNDDPASVVDNAANVVRMIGTSPDTRLDGVTITGGIAMGLGVPAGAGLRIVDGFGTIANCIIERNYALSSNSSAGFAVVNSAVTFDSCILRENVSAFTSGAGGFSGDLGSSLIDCTIANNASAIEVGGIDVTTAFGSDASFELRGCVIRNNSASRHAALRISVSNLIMADCIVTGNTSPDTTVTFGGGTCRLSVTDSCFIDNCTFTDNISHSNGGALAISSSADMLIRDSTFIGNIGLDGGAIELQSTDLVTIENSAFVDNVALFRGGSVVADATNDHIVITASTLLDNTAVIGGAAWLAADTIDVTSSLVRGNHASLDAGGLHIGSETTSPITTIKSTAFQMNNAIGHGGGLHTLTDTIITACSFDENVAGFGGGVAARMHAALTLHDGVFTSNDAVFDGAGLAIVDVVSETPTTVDDTLFQANASRRGAGIALRGLTDHVVNVRHSTFIDNVADESAGGVLLDDVATCLISDSSFIDNASLLDGGAVRAVDAGTAALTRCAFTSNVSMFGEGGAVRLDNVDTMAFVDMMMSGNDAVLSGAEDGVYALHSDVVVIGGAIDTHPGSGIFAREGSTSLQSFHAGDDVTIDIGDGSVSDCAFDDAALIIEGSGRIEHSVFAGGQTPTAISLLHSLDDSVHQRVDVVHCDIHGYSTGITSALVDEVNVGNCRIGASFQGISISIGTGVIANCVLSGGPSSTGIRIVSSPLTIHHCVFFGNEIGIEQVFENGAVVYNSAFDLNGDNQLSDHLTGLFADPPTAVGCFFPFESDSSGKGNFTGSAAFVDPDGPDDIFGTSDDDSTIGMRSDLIDRGQIALPAPDRMDLDSDGDVDESLPVDLLGQPRVINAIPDVGPIEVVPMIVDCAADCGGVGPDGDVDIDDLFSLLTNFGGVGSCDIVPVNGDGTIGDDIINVDDLFALLNTFGACDDDDT